MLQVRPLHLPQVHLGRHSVPQGPGAAVSRIVQHPHYDPATTDYDFALVKLAARVDFQGEMRAEKVTNMSEPAAASPRVAPVCLPASTRPTFSGAAATVAGWGVTQEGGAALAGALREVTLTIMADAECR